MYWTTKSHLYEGFLLLCYCNSNILFIDINRGLFFLPYLLTNNQERHDKECAKKENPHNLSRSPKKKTKNKGAVLYQIGDSFVQNKISRDLKFNILIRLKQN